MTKKFALLLFCCILFAPVLLGQKIYPLKQVKPGMKVWIKTDLGENKRPTIFTGRVLGIVPVRYGLDGKTILIKMNDQVSSRYGASFVVHGMSGSPVYDRNPYLDGRATIENKAARIVGGLALRVGKLPIESIAGVTPIETMLGVFDDPKGEPQYSASSGYSAYQSDSSLLVTTGLSADLKSAFLNYTKGKGDINFMDLSLDLEFPEADKYSGILPSLAKKLPAPGSMIVVSLVRGKEINVGGGCTLTYLDKKTGKFLACGHLLEGFGRVSLPAYRVKVVTTLKDREAPTKVPGEIAKEPFGAIVVDRTASIGGLVGEAARMIQVDVDVKMGDKEKIVHAGVAQVPSALDLLTLVVLKGLEVGDISKARLMDMKGSIVLRGTEPDGREALANLEISRVAPLSNLIDTLFGSVVVTKDQAIYGIVREVVNKAISGLLNAPPDMNVRLEKVDLRIALLDQSGGFSRQDLQIWNDEGQLVDANDFFSHTEVLRGESFSFVVSAKDLYSQSILQSFFILKIPEDAELGPAELTIGNGSSINDWWDMDKSRSTDTMYQNGFSGLVDYLTANERSNKTIYIKLLLPNPKPKPADPAVTPEQLKWQRIERPSVMSRELNYQFAELPFPVNFERKVISLRIVEKKTPKAEKKGN